jgi:hypothetical protein
MTDSENLRPFLRVSGSPAGRQRYICVPGRPSPDSDRTWTGPPNPLPSSGVPHAWAER